MILFLNTRHKDLQHKMTTYSTRKKTYITRAQNYFYCRIGGVVRCDCTGRCTAVISLE